MAQFECPKCGKEGSAENFVKNGFRNGNQCYRCKSCGYQITNDEKYKKHSMEDIRIAVALHNYGLSFRTVAKIVGVSSPSEVHRWFHKYKGKIKVEKDDLHIFLNKKKDNSRLEKRIKNQINDLLKGKLSRKR